MRALTKNSNRGRMLQELVGLREGGDLPGLLGRLGDLGGISSTYDVAISTACGQLDHIVVENVTTAESCITFLKVRGLGRASFIALDKQQHFWKDIDRAFHVPTQSERLFDLIDVSDRRILPAFYFALRDTLVTRDLQRASEIAYGPMRRRVVTLSGALIEASGTLSGGGGAPRHSKMGRTVAESTDPHLADKMAELEGSLAGMRAQHQKNKDLLNTLNDKMVGLSKELSELKTLENKLVLELKVLTNRLTGLPEKVSHQKQMAAESVTDKDTVSRFENLISEHRTALDEAQLAVNEVQAAVTLIRKKISEISPLKPKQKQLSEVTDKVQKLVSEASASKVEIKSAERNLSKVDGIILDLETNLEEFVVRIEETRTEISSISGDIENFSKIKISYKTKLSQFRSEVNSRNEKIAHLSKNDNKYKHLKICVENEIRDLKNEISELNSRIPVFQTKLKNLVLNLAIPDEEDVPLKQFSEQELNETISEDLLTRTRALSTKIEGLRPNRRAVDDFEAKQRLYNEMAVACKALMKQVAELRQLGVTVGGLRLHEFMVGFGIIGQKVKEVYQMLSLGGDAELDLVCSTDPFREGLLYNIRPPKKSWKTILNLSGGEKTLASLAMVFALHYFRPSALYMMDEIDAALDKRNVEVVARYIQEETLNSQFIVISLCETMLRISKRLIGICKVDDCSMAITISLDEEDEDKDKEIIS